jgi:hypothetical protein
MQDTTADAGDTAVETADFGTAPIEQGKSQEATPAAPESAETATRTFSQEDVDRIVQQRVARLQAKQQREAQTQAIRERILPSADPNNPPQREQFASDHEYVDAVAGFKASVATQQIAQVEAINEARAAFEDRAEVFAQKAPDYYDLVQDPTFPLAPASYWAALKRENGPEIVYHLAKNRAEAERISRLAPLDQAAEIGALARELQQKTALAAARRLDQPITPLQGGKSTNPTSDPANMRTFNTPNDAAAWIAARNKKR